MNVLKIVTGLILLLVVLQGGVYLNLMVSDKYETDDTIIKLSDISEDEKKKKYEELTQRTLEIQDQKRTTLIRGGVLLFVLIVLCVILMNKSGVEM